MKVVHSWLKDYLGGALPDAEKVEELFSLHAFEIEEVIEEAGETVIDVDILPNRASDALSHRGVARELATLLNIELEQDPFREAVKLAKTDKIKIEIADPEACPRFTTTLITGVEIKESPKWLQTRLLALGQRPINNIVDATNYVMYALGQPMHAYDADKFPQKDGVWQFGVRFAKAGERIALLPEGGKDEDRVVELTGSELLIVDGSTDTPVGLAGIKGGRHAELHEGTTNIIIEAANFHPTAIRKTARRLGILTDASKRFENAPSQKLPPYAQREIITLITKIAGGTFEGMVDASSTESAQATVAVSVEKINGLLGLSLTTHEIKDIIKRIGATVEERDGGLIATGPWERNDLNIEEDYIEEVGRIHGLFRVTSIEPELRAITEVSARQCYSEQVRHALMAVGFSEVVTSSFAKKGNIQLQNALASDKSCMRETLVKNITSVLDANYVHCDLLGIPDVRVFEIGTVFEKTDGGVGEYVALTLGVRTKGNGYNPKDDKVLEAGVQAVEAALGTSLEWQKEKGVAEANLSAVLETLPVPSAYDPLPERAPITYKTPSPYPAISRDIALWVDEEKTDEVVAAILSGPAGDLLVRRTLFDTFKKDGRTSYAFRFVFQSHNRTLTDTEVNELMEKVYEVAKKQGWEVR